MKPYLIVITGRPGAGKTTLSERLSREWSLPLISRDRIKEGYVHTKHSTHDELTDQSNLTATNAFFDVIHFMLDRNISCIVEAAFQHRLWAARLPQLQEKANIHIIICRIDAQIAQSRILKRGLDDPSHVIFHGDPGVKAVIEGRTPEIAPYDEPYLPFPTHYVDTTDNYQPPVESLRSKIGL